MIIGIDASRNRSGGARAHLIGILSAATPLEHGIKEVHVWSYRTLLDEIPDFDWLYKHGSESLERGLLQQMLWQRLVLPKLALRERCEIFLNTDAGSISAISPVVTMSRDMLSYEPGEMERYGWSKPRLRLYLLKLIQNRSFRRSDGVIFLTKHAAETIQMSCGKLSNVGLIPHGVGENFKQVNKTAAQSRSISSSFKLLYISNADLYKHQWKVVEAVEILRKRGINLELTLVGGGSGKAQQLLDKQIKKSDPDSEYIFQETFVSQSELPRYLAEADIFIFASSCENMPNTLVEAMAAGLPIACSDRGPMPEVLEDGGIYFDPENVKSVVDAIHLLLKDENLRETKANRSRILAQQYTWERCARETWSFLVETLKKRETDIE